MSGDRVILAVKYTPVASPAQLRRQVGGFLLYVQYRDRHGDANAPAAPAPEVSGMLKYVAHRDGSAAAGRLFGPRGTAGDDERRQLANFVARSIRGSGPQLAPDGKGGTVDRRRALYRFVLSPEKAEGLDLRQLTKAAISRLDADAGGSGLHWIAAEHRNTAHPHVHILLAGIREVGPGQYRSLILNQRRLAGMKETLAFEIQRQRGARVGPEAPEPVALPVRKLAAACQPNRREQAPARVLGRPTGAMRRRLRPHAGRRFSALILLQAAARRYRQKLERQAREEQWRSRERSR